MMTLAGGKAAGIAKWAWGDPASRVQTAIEQVRELAAQTADPDELAEIQDAGTMLSRLAGTLRPQTISAQLAVEGTITAQFLELAKGGGWHDSWRHERRGPHGEWIGTGGLSAPGGRVKAERLRKLSQARQERLVKAEVARQAPPPSAPASTAGGAMPGSGNKAADIAAQARAATAKYDPVHGFDPTVKTNAPPDLTLPEHDPAKWEREHEAFFQQRVAPHVEKRAEAMLEQAVHNTEDGLEKLRKEGDIEENRKAVKKLAVEGSVAIGAAILAYLETKIGVPDLAAIATSAMATLTQVIIEWRKQL